MTKDELEALADLRLKEAKVLFENGLRDGSGNLNNSYK